MAAGTGFAISYVSDISQVTQDNLVVFTLAHNTPWKRVVTYEVPAKMPACPEEGCICAFGWVPNGCGLANMYMAGFKCKVTGSTSTTALAKPNPPVWCEGDPSSCTKGPKQFISWHQAQNNNIEVDGLDSHGDRKSPAYNLKLGFANGAQNDIFADSDGTPAEVPANTPASTPSSTPVNSPSSTPVNTASSTTPSNTPPADTQVDVPADSPPSDPSPSDPSPSNSSPNPSPSNAPSNAPSNNDAPAKNPNKGACRSSNSKKRRSAFVKKSTGANISSHRRNTRFTKLRRAEKLW
jgi:uncharacterized Zn-binding protein involved in type VI secretion